MIEKSRIAVLLSAAGLLLFAGLSSAAARPPHARCATSLFHDEQVATAASLLRPSEGGPSERFAGKRMTPPPNPNVGDRWEWYIWMLNGPPQAVLRSCTVRGEGNDCYVVVEDGQWNVNINQAQVDTILARFESHTPGPFSSMGIYQLDTLAFGQPPDELDNDPKVYLLYYDFDVNSDGFFWYFDEYPDGSLPYASNECEVVYLNCSDNDPSGDYMVAVAAHEFEHMIHWNHDENEDLWVDEGCAELAMWLYGNPDQISSFNSNPNDPLVTWGGSWTDYIQTYLWTLYFYEQYGGMTSVRALVADPLNSTYGYDSVLSTLGYGVGFTDVFGDWVVANFVDDPTLLDGRYGYVGDNLPAFLAATYSSYPIGPLSQNVQPTACKYKRLINGFPMQLDFDGWDGTVWEPSVIYYSGTTAIDVAGIPLDGANAGSIILDQFGSTYDSVVVAFAHASSYGGNGFTWGTDAVTGVPPALREGTRLDPNSPNPFNPSTEIHLSVEEPGPVTVTIHDAAGRLVRTLFSGVLEEGERTLVWDGRDDGRREVPSGVYFYRLDTERRSLSRKMTLVR